MRRLAGYPQWFFSVFTLVCAALLVTGILLLPHMLQMRMDMDVPIQLGGEFRLVAAAAHATAGFLVIGFAGALLSLHARIGWRRRLNRISGIALLGLIAIMLLTAVGIYYFGDELCSRASSTIHAAAGLIASVAFVWHMVKGGRLRRAISLESCRNSGLTERKYKS